MGTSYVSGRISRKAHMSDELLMNLRGFLGRASKVTYAGNGNDTKPWRKGLWNSSTATAIGTAVIAIQDIYAHGDKRLCG
jgi:hypothetical protein